MYHRRKKYSYLELIVLIGFQVALFFVFISRLNDIGSIYRLGTTLKLVIPEDKPYTNPNFKTFSAPEIFAEWKKQHKKIIRIDLTGDLEEDKNRLESIHEEARRLKYTYDTTHILKVHLTDDNMYGQFIQLLSMIQAEMHKRYMLFENDFYILGESPPESK